MTHTHIKNLVATLVVMAYEGEEGTTTTTDSVVKAFTQEDVNKLLAEDRRKHTDTNKKLVGEIEALRGRSTLTETEKGELESRVSELSKTLLTKEELAKDLLDKTNKRYKQEQDTIVAERDSWKTRYTEKTINNSIISEASTANAVNAKQLVAILRPNTRLVEVLEEGKPTGDFDTVVDYQSKDDKGKPVKLVLPVGEAIKKMKEDSEYMNLFRGEGTGGVGGINRGGGSGAKGDLASVARDAATYREMRKKTSL